MRGGIKTLKHNVRTTLQLSYHGCKYLTHTSKTPHVKRTEMVVTVRLNTGMREFETSQKEESIQVCASLKHRKKKKAYRYARV